MFSEFRIELACFGGLVVSRFFGGFGQLLVCDNGCDFDFGRNYDSVVLVRIFVGF